jgi:hypothetical protein
VRTSLAQLESSGAKTANAWRMVDFWSGGALIFPPKEYFTAPAWENVAERIWDRALPARRASEPSVPEALLHSELLGQALTSRFLTMEDLATRGATPEAMREYLDEMPSAKRVRLLELSPIPVHNTNYSVLPMDVPWPCGWTSFRGSDAWTSSTAADVGGSDTCAPGATRAHTWPAADRSRT